MKRKRLLILIVYLSIVVVALITATVFWWLNFEYGMPVGVSSIIVTHSELSEGKVCIEGNTTNSGLAFSGYSYKKDGNNGYITLRYVIVNGRHLDGKFSASSNNNDELDNLYIQGIENKTLLAWSK